MPYLRWRRIKEMASIDRPWLGRLLLRRDQPHALQGPEQWDADYRGGEYDRLFRGEQRHHQRLLAALVAEAAPAARILDVGCGEGAFYESMRRFAPEHYDGIDISDVAIRRAAERYAADIAAGRASFTASDGQAHVTASRFDVIVFSECIEYLGEVEQVVGHYRGLLRPGGCFAITMWLGSGAVRRWWRLRELAEVQDEAVVNAAWGGAWLVARLLPR